MARIKSFTDSITTNNKTTADRTTAPTHEDLYLQARDGNEQALWRLCTDYRALFISESRKYATAMADLMDTSDWISIGNILVWDIVSKGNFDPTVSSWGAYLKTAVRWRFTKVYERHVTKGNMVITFQCVHTDDDSFTRYFGKGYGDRYYGVSEKAEKYRNSQRERNRRYQAKRYAEVDRVRAEQGLPPVYRPSVATEEEKARHREQVEAKRKAGVKRYQQEHKEEIRVKKAKYYQEHKEQYRLTDAIRRTKKSIERFEAEGRVRMAEKARVRLAGFEEKYAAIKTGA